MDFVKTAHLWQVKITAMLLRSCFRQKETLQSTCYMIVAVTWLVRLKCDTKPCMCFVLKCSFTTGDSESDQAARARLQGGDLLQSDMAAFKAANPACQLADFVRWHSPKDWQPDPHHPQGGHISDRMSHQVTLLNTVSLANVQ